jgi:hypothetical protein
MVKKIKTKTRIEALEWCYENLLKRLEALEEQVKTNQPNEVDEKTKIDDWLTDDRVDDVQVYLHKGIK